MAKIVWSEELSVNILALDSKHKRLVQLLNDLNDAMTKGQGNAVLSNILTELVSYAKTHFKHEEDIMEKHGYPKLDVQKQEHREFMEKVKDVIDKHQRGTTLLSISIFEFLVSWIKNHIMKSDKAYSKFLNEKGVN